EDLEKENTKLLDEYAEMEEPTPAFTAKIRALVIKLGTKYTDINEDVNQHPKSVAVNKQLRGQMQKLSLWMRTWDKVLAL
ncbi:hypothetical protein HY490_00135, partial [Candidatus Woesearchaeota archaeon]|nr:hypothetical protein [Candidatus Woesearchaeota archaeon]